MFSQNCRLFLKPPLSRHGPAYCPPSYLNGLHNDAHPRVGHHPAVDLYLVVPCHHGVSVLDPTHPVTCDVVLDGFLFGHGDYLLCVYYRRDGERLLTSSTYFSKFRHVILSATHPSAALLSSERAKNSSINF